MLQFSASPCWFCGLLWGATDTISCQDIWSDLLDPSTRNEKTLHWSIWPPKKNVSQQNLWVKLLWGLQPVWHTTACAIHSQQRPHTQPICRCTSESCGLSRLCEITLYRPLKLYRYQTYPVTQQCAQMPRQPLVSYPKRDKMQHTPLLVTCLENQI